MNTAHWLHSIVAVVAGISTDSTSGFPLVSNTGTIVNRLDLDTDLVS